MLPQQHIKSAEGDAPEDDRKHKTVRDPSCQSVSANRRAGSTQAIIPIGRGPRVYLPITHTAAWSSVSIKNDWLARINLHGSPYLYIGWR
jgi:hypothetical protein